MFSEFPAEILKMILVNCITYAGEDPLIFNKLSCVCKKLHEALKHHPEIWDSAWEIYKVRSADGYGPGKDLWRMQLAECESARPPPQLRLSLMGAVGCMFCGSGTVRIFYWAFSLRSCWECLRERTVTEILLREHYLRDEASELKSLLHGLPFRELEVLTFSTPRPSESMVTRQYLIKDVLQRREVPALRSLLTKAKEKSARKRRDAKTRAEAKRAKQAREENSKAAYMNLPIEERRAQRRAALLTMCQQADKGLTPAILATSRTFHKSARLGTPLSEKAFKRIFPAIKAEVRFQLNRRDRHIERLGRETCRLSD